MLGEGIYRMKGPEDIVKQLQITEKGTDLIDGANKYLVKVDPSSNKIEIKKAVEELFKVTVIKVNTMNYKGKKKRMRTVKYGKRSDWKRAVVTLKEGDTIDLI